MIDKIISGGQTWPEIAALDTAIKLGIPYTGWQPAIQVPSRLVKTDHYRLQTLSSNRPKDAIAKNIKESDGAFILSQGRLQGQADYARQMTLKNHKQLLGIDLGQHPPFEAARLLASWIEMNHIRALYVTGSHGGKGSTVYHLTLYILESAIAKARAGSPLPDLRRPPAGLENALPARPPATVDGAVKQLTACLTLKEKTAIASSRIEVLLQPGHPLGRQVRQFFKLRRGNDPLKTSCINVSGEKTVTPDEASRVIIRSFWRHLQQTHCLRVVKK